MTESHPIRVVLIDDHRHIHEAVALLLASVDDIQLIAQGSNGNEALTLRDTYSPDIVLMDVVMPGLNGVEATKAIREKDADVKILALSSFQDDESVREMMANGATGYVLKGSLSANLINAIRAAYTGSTVLDAAISQTLLQSATAPQNTFGLTERELEVLKLMAQGMNNNEIAHALVVSRSTVKFHISNLIEKMDVGSRAEAIVLATRNHLV